MDAKELINKFKNSKKINESYYIATIDDEFLQGGFDSESEAESYLYDYCNDNNLDVDDFVIYEEEGEKETFEIPVRLIFEGKVTVKASDLDEAEYIVLNNFSGILDHCENNLHDEITDWDVDIHSDIELND